MKFGPVPLKEAEGGILAHSVEAGGKRFRKGQKLGPAEISALAEAGTSGVVAAILSDDDLDENAAAARIASALQVLGISVHAAATGRVNLHAAVAGLFTVDRALVDALNRIDPAVTLATLPCHAAVVAEQMVATVKIIPFAVPAGVVEEVVQLCASSVAAAVHAFHPSRIALVQTTLPGVKASVLDKTSRTLADRLRRSNSRIIGEARVAHDASAVAEAIAAALPRCDLVVLFGASAVSDAEDVLPAAIRAAGGTVARVGMPVDPGNLLVLGKVGGTHVIGAPGCARSPKENGFDWVLDRLLAGLDVSADDLAGMGVGGLLTEIPTRPQPREAGPKRGRVQAVVLAAGRSSRMGGPNKLMARFGEQPLIRVVTERVLASRADSAIVVSGHQAERVAAALEGLPIRLVHNEAYASGLASSLKAGVSAATHDARGALVVLGDMPGVTTKDLNRMIAAFEKAGSEAVVRATAHGKRGNPVILPRALFDSVMTLEGDAGARSIVESADAVDVELGDGAALDVDTPDALAQAGGELQD